MTDWLLRSIGLGDELVAGIERVEWAWTRPDWLVLGLLFLLPAAWYVVVRHRRSLGHIAARPRAVLSACRIAVLALLVFVLGGPYLKIEERIERKPVLAIVVDESASMDLPAGPFEEPQLRDLAQAAGMIEAAGEGEGDEPLPAEMRDELNEWDRATLLRAIFAEREHDLLPELGERFDLHYYGVGRGVRELETFADAGELTPFQRGETALGGAIEQVLDDAGGRPIAGIVLLTDGRSTTGPDPVQVARAIGNDNGNGDDAPRAPVWAVPVGSDTPAPALMLIDALAPARVGLGDTVNVVATVGAHGFDDEPATVRLLEGDRVLDEREIRISSGGRQQVELIFEADDPGQRLLQVAIDPHEDERVTENNARSVAIEVDEERVRLLYLEGAPRWDFRFLDHALRRDGGVEARFVMEQQLRADGVAPDDLPTAAGLSDDVDDLAEYDVIMLGDVSRLLLTDGVLAALIEAVEDEGVGLLVQAGTEHMPHDYLDTPLAELLPLRFAPHDANSERGGIEAEAYAPFRMSVTATGAMHPALALYGSAARNRQLWNRMPVFFRAAAATDARSGATVLAEMTTASDRRPLIASQFVGGGRVMFVGLDSTFRWRRNVGDQLFYRFWGQSLRYVARSDRRGDRSWVEVEPGEVEPGTPVAVELYAVDADGEPLAAPTLPMTVQAVGDAHTPPQAEPQPLELTRLSQQEGRYRAVWQAREPGTYRFMFDHHQPSPLSATVRVADSGRELLHPTVDRETLTTLADLSGGGVIELDDLDRLPRRLVGEPTTLYRAHERPVWDNWLMLLLLVGLYCTDVAIRRMMGLN